MRNKPASTSMLLITALVLFAATPSLALANSAAWSAMPATVQSSPSVVQVVVTYQGRNPAVGTVTVQAVVNDVVVTSFVPISLVPGQTVVIPVAFCGVVQAVKSISAGGGSPTTVSAIGDDMNPV